jgi:signal transduction histidine kinase
VEEFASSLQSEREVAQMQIARTQDLAGVGLSVESASHDLIASGAEALRLARLLLLELKQLGLVNEYAFTLGTTLVQRLEFVDSRFQDVQGLFVSTRQKRGVVDVVQVVRRVRSMYSALHKTHEIELVIEEESHLKAMTTEGAVLQALINLVDNATYWLMAGTQTPRQIRVYVAAPGVLAVSDSGPGVAPADQPYIFEAFYSGKGDSGKGLGLFIAREVGARNGFEVSLEPRDDPRALRGATFTLRFAEVVA